MLAFAVPAGAAVVYRWVDEQGKVHDSEVVPERYRKSAKPVDVRPNAPSAEQQRRAAERAERDKARAAEAARAASSSAAPAASAAASGAASAPAPAKRPPSAPTEATDCDTWRRLYRESLECFAPYRTARGTTKAEAFEHCTPVPEPPIRCGREAR